MENQSIESIWKKGFLSEKQLIAPKINNLYAQKSIHLIDSFHQRFKWNIWGIIIGATGILIISLLIGATLAGLSIFGLLLFVARSAKQDQSSLKEIDKGKDSYTYLKEFKGWIEHSIEKYGSLYRYVYPSLILSFYFGLWFSDIATVIRGKVVDAGQELIWGLHPTTTICVIISAMVMAILSKPIHREDVKFIYGSIMRKLDELIVEMEELRGEE